MKFLSAFLLLFGLLVLPGVVFASGCSEQEYLNSCAACTFNEYGMMEEECKKSYEESGKTCLISKYPSIVYLYANPSSCPGLSNCKMEFNMCKANVGTGTDQGDCQSAQVQECFKRADTCIAKAISTCDAETNPCAAIFIIPGILALTLFTKRK